MVAPHRSPSWLLISGLVWLSFLSGRASCSTQEIATPDYLIVGAGGSGIQTALLLNKYNHSCLILEKQDHVGSFWTNFPAFRELISVNKKVRNETQQWKYDWHSMLDAPLKMQDVSTDYFPQGSDWQEYMARVVQEANIKVEFGTEVVFMAPDNSPCVYLKSGEKRCAKHRVFMGTGMKEKNEPLLEAFGGIPYSQMTKEAAREKHVCILGNGNAGFETAHNVYDIAERVVLYGKHPYRLSAITRYTGDVRTKFLQPVENFHAKLLDTVDYFAAGIQHSGLDREFKDEEITKITDAIQSSTFLKRFECEVFVIATGFESHVPGLHFSSRFPPSNDWYVSSDNNKVHYIGWLMHERDFRRGSGGFLSGYRYLLRNLVHHINDVDHGIPYPHTIMTKEQVIDHVVDRLQVADDLIILQDGVLLNDVIIPLYDGTDRYQYYQGITLPFHHELNQREDAIKIYFAWGNGRKASVVFEDQIRYSDSGSLINLFLHPVIETKGLTRHTHEDIEMAWSDPSSEATHHKVIREALNGDLQRWRPKPDFPYERSKVNHTEEVDHFEPSNRQAVMSDKLLSLVMDAVRSGYNPGKLRKLKEFSKQWFSTLHSTEAHADAKAQ